jgi:Xaa-Pro aminopeptidase
MERVGVDLFVGLSSAFHNFLECDSVVSLTGFRPMGPSTIVVRRNGDSWLLVGPEWDVQRAVSKCSGATVLGCSDLAVGLAALLRDVGVGHVVGTAVAEAFPVGLLDRVIAVLGPNRKAVDGLLLEAGAVKSLDELADARRATWIAEQGYQHMLEYVQPGMREFELAGELLCYMKSLGSHDNFFLMSASQHNQAVRPPGRRILERGDILLAEITPAVNSQFSQICRTVVLGPATEQLRDRFALLKTATAAGQAAAIAGASVSAAAKAMNGVIAGAGFGQYCKPPYMRVRGHGLGNISSVPGEVAEDNQVVLKKGMIFVIHPNQYFPDVGYLLCGEPVVITDNMAEPLSESPAQLDHVNA